MVQAGGDLDLPQESLGPERGCQLGAENLDGHRPLVPYILGEIHRGHTTVAQFGPDGVPAGECGRQLVAHFAQETCLWRMVFSKMALTHDVRHPPRAVG